MQDKGKGVLSIKVDFDVATSSTERRGNLYEACSRDGSL